MRLRVYCSGLNILFSVVCFSPFIFPLDANPRSECFANICLLFYLNIRTIGPYTGALFTGLHRARRWLPHLYSWWFGPKPIFYNQFFFFFFFAFKDKHVSKRYWLDETEFQTSQRFFLFIFRTNKHVHGLYECLYDKARRVLAKLHLPLTLRGGKEILACFWNHVGNYKYVRRFSPSA